MNKLFGVLAVMLAFVLLFGCTGQQAQTSPPSGQQPTNPPPQAGPGQPAAQGDWSFIASEPRIGPAGAKVTVVEFADFQCPFCGIVFGNNIGGPTYDPIRGTATKIADEYAKTGKVRFVYVPMAFLGQESIDAANAAFCAREIGGDEGFFAMHDKLFAMQGNENSGVFTKDNIKKYGTGIGFDSAAFTSCIDSGKYLSQVNAATDNSGSVGVKGTPTFAVNNKIVPNGAEYTALKTAIDAALGS